MAEMTGDEWRAFIRAPARPAMLAPVWIVVDDDDTLVFTTGATTVKGPAVAGGSSPGRTVRRRRSAALQLRPDRGYGGGE